MRRSVLRTLVLAIAVMALLAGCSGDDSSAAGDDASTSTDDTATDGFDQEAFCDAAGDFGTAQTGAPEASTPEEVEERLTAMSDAADAIVETAPADVTEDAQAFADAIHAFEQYGADRDFEVDLGAAAPEYQSGDGAAVVEEITNTIAPVDQAVQDECDRFLSEAA
jgi:ABC-type glycerol-3-phosphate transport system substrate-binding protein